MKARKVDSELLQPAFIEACTRMKNFIKDGIDESDLSVAKLSIQVISGYGRLRAVENNESMIRFHVATALSDNIEQLKSSIKKSLPEYVDSEK